MNKEPCLVFIFSFVMFVIQVRLVFFLFIFFIFVYLWSFLVIFVIFFKSSFFYIWMYILKRNKKNVFLNRPKTKLSRKKVNDITHYLLTYLLTVIGRASDIAH